MRPVLARVVILAGPSGAGKTRLASATGRPVVTLDDFYRDGTDAALPRVTGGVDRGLVDWDHPDSWLADEAVAALERLCRTGETTLPDYRIADNARRGTRRLTVGDSTLVLAEGIFAQEIVPALAERGLLAAALCVTSPPALVFARRLVRDLREHRKPPGVLVVRGLRLARGQAETVRHAIELGCEPVTPAEAARRIDRIATASDPARAQRWVTRALAQPLPQPDDRSCGAACAVVAAMLADADYAEYVATGTHPRTRRTAPGPVADRFARETLTAHRELTGWRAPGTAHRWQPPWPRAWGTPPWSLARRLSRLTGTRLTPRWALTPASRHRLVVDVSRLLTEGHPVALYVGNAATPRHVVLALGIAGSHWRVWEPGRGVVCLVDPQRLAAGTQAVGGWRRLWCAIGPSPIRRPGSTR